MEKELNIILMVLFIQVNLLIMKRMGKENIFLKIIQFMKVILKIIYIMEKELIFGVMEDIIKENLKME